MTVRERRSPDPIVTERLRLRPWSTADGDVFATLNADPDVMRDLGGPLDRDASDRKLERFRAAFATNGFGRWCIERIDDGTFIGYAGMMPHGDDHPLGAHVDVGWRLTRRAWGQGAATEAARVAIDDGFTRVGLAEIVAYTAADNHRSQSVIERLRLTRQPERDFTIDDEVLGSWHGLVWSAQNPAIGRTED